MAQSRRNLESPLSMEDEEAAQKNRDRGTLLMFGFGGIMIVAAMFWIAGFLSNSNGGSPLNTSLYIAVGAAIPTGIGWWMSRVPKSD